MTTLSKGTTVDTTHHKPGELIHMDFSFYNLTYNLVFTSIPTVFCAKTIMIWVFDNVSKRSPVLIICFILTTLTNEKHPCRRVRFDEDETLEKSTDVTNLLVDDFSIYMETNGDDA